MPTSILWPGADLRLAPAALLVVLVTGCAVKTYPVEGKVVFKDGKPLTAGSVEFESTTPPHTRAGGTLDEQGHFVLSTNREGSGAMEGEHRVRIDPELPERFEESLGPDAAKAKAKIVPQRYLSYETTPLKFVVTPEKNFITIEIERPSAR